MLGRTVGPNWRVPTFRERENFIKIETFRQCYTNFLYKNAYFFFPSPHSILSLFFLYPPVTLLLQMSSEILWSTVFLLLVDCATILFWFFFGHVKKRQRPHKNEIFICGDCWLLVFDFLAPSQLGLEIALINRRFNCIVDEHFKTRKWKLGCMRICHKIGENGTKQLQIVNSDAKPLPIPQNPLPNKVIGFRHIQIHYIDQNVIAFLRRFHRRIFDVCSMVLYIHTDNDRILDYFLLNIWPMFRHSMRLMNLNSISLRRLRQLAGPSLLSDCPSLRFVSFNEAILPAFPPDESANASDGQALAKWLFTPRPDGQFKWFRGFVNSPDQWSPTMEQLKTAFSNASSPITYRISLAFSSTSIDSVVPFDDLINEVTGEKLTLEQNDTNDCWLSRCPIAWDYRKWKNLSDGIFDQMNPIDILISDGGFDDGLLLDAASPGPSDQ